MAYHLAPSFLILTLSGARDFWSQSRFSQCGMPILLVEAWVRWACAPNLAR